MKYNRNRAHKPLNDEWRGAFIYQQRQLQNGNGFNSFSQLLRGLKRVSQNASRVARQKRRK